MAIQKIYVRDIYAGARHGGVIHVRPAMFNRRMQTTYIQLEQSQLSAKVV